MNATAAATRIFPATPDAGDEFDAEGFPIATDLATIPVDGTQATIHLPGAVYATSFSVRRVLDAPGVVEISRDGKGDTLFINLATARTRMAPVRRNGHGNRDKTVAFLGLPTDGAQPQVSWGLGWTLGTDTGVGYYDDALDALVELGRAYLV